MIPWLIVAQIISETNESLYELVSDLEKEFPCSGEINLPASHVDRVMQAVEKEYAKRCERNSAYRWTRDGFRGVAV